MQNFWWLIVLYLCISKDAADAINVTKGQSLPGDQSAEPGRRALNRENSGDLGTDLELNLTQNKTENSKGTDTQGTRVRRSSLSSGECEVSTDDLHGLYSTMYGMLSVKTRVNKINSFHDCSVGFQNIKSTARDLNREVTTLSTSQEMQNKDYDSLKKQYEKAAKEMQDQINKLQNRQDESNPELERILAKLKELSRQKEEAEAEKKSLTDFQEVRLSWQKTLQCCKSSGETQVSLTDKRSSSLSSPENKTQVLSSYRKQGDLNGLFSNATICRILPQQLFELHTLLQSSTQTIWSQFLPDSATAQPQPLHTNDTSCDHRTQSLRSKLLELKDSFNFYVRNANTFNLQRRESLTLSQEEQIAELTKRKDDLAQSIRQKHAQTTDTHQSILQNRQQEVNDIRTQIKQLKDSEKRAAIDVAAALIRCKEKTWAVAFLKRIAIHFGPSNDPISGSAWEQLIKNVVGIAYNKSIDNLEKLLDFANQLPKINEVITANEAIYEEMRKLGQLNNPYILLLAHQVDGVIHSPKRAKGARERSENDRLRNLQTNLNKSVTGVLRTWARSIISQETSHIGSFPRISIKAANSFNHYLPRLVQTTYDAGRLSSVEKLLDFANQLPKINEVITANEAIYEEMRKLGQLNSPYILLLSHQVDGVIHWPERAKGVRGRSLNDRLRNLESKLNESVNGVLSIWANNINSEDTKHIARFPTLSVKTANGFNHYLPRLVQTTYNAGRLSSVEKLLKFGKDLQWYSHWGTVMSQLFQAMKRHGDIARHSEISLLAYDVKKALEKPNKDHVMEESRHLFQGVKDGLPGSVRAVLWNRWVKVWSTHRSGYALYSYSSFGTIYTVLFDKMDRNEQPLGWDVFTGSDGRFFSFRNREYKKYLCSDSEGHADLCNPTSDTSKDWEIYPSTNDGYLVYIRNRKTREFLFAGKENTCPFWRSRPICFTVNAGYTNLDNIITTDTDTDGRWMWVIT